MEGRGTGMNADGRVRRQRGATESLGQVVLAAESIVVFLAGLVVFGLGATPDTVPTWWAIAGGAVLAVTMITVSALMRYRWARVAGWVLQVLLALAGLLVPAIVLVAVVFAGMYGYATIKGGSLDRGRSAEPPDPGEDDDAH